MNKDLNRLPYGGSQGNLPGKGTELLLWKSYSANEHVKGCLEAVIVPVFQQGLPSRQQDSRGSGRFLWLIPTAAGR